MLKTSAVIETLSFNSNCVTATTACIEHHWFIIFIGDIFVAKLFPEPQTIQHFVERMSGTTRAALERTAA